MKTPPPPTGPAAVAAWLLGVATVLGACTSTDDPTPPPPPTARLHELPARLAWITFQGIALPVAEQGPRDYAGPVAAGFDRSPVGAALAAIHATVRISVATDSQWPLLVQQMTAPGPGRDSWAVARAQISLTTPPTTPPRLLGYQITRYTPDLAQTAIYTRQPDASLTRNTATVVWRDGDWRLQLPDDPSHPAAVTAVITLPADAVALPQP
ncbi:hypothetical protein BJY24_005784 [Nocardia transvalensis]|uniref:DUF8175 domain-containing protein n=1 Tax=Nocardia transvalensis TaxID=37333 RepID=A0A7W9PIU3_9NOCA|nr:hypothetical protein [Nocardia transvalensis]MBB5916872.1 hypothetical protein [Nocardia transvalensis]